MAGATIWEAEAGFEDGESWSVEFDVAPHQFHNETVHLWIDPADDKTAHSLVTIDMSADEALTLVDSLLDALTQLGIRKVKGA